MVSYGRSTSTAASKSTRLCPGVATAKIPSSISFVDAAVLSLALDSALVGLSGSPSEKTIVLLGGSSSVGALTIQLAVASARNHAFVHKAGAVAAFDYNDESVVVDVVEALKKDGGEVISMPDSSKYVLPIVEKAGGVNLATVLDPPADAQGHLKISRIMSVDPPTDKVWESCVTPALEQGALKPIPRAYVIGKGLESLQKELDENKKGVSAQKVVIEV